MNDVSAECENQNHGGQKSADVTRYKITIEYIGKEFAGWQRQPNVPSVQQSIEEAIAAFYSYDDPPQLYVAGRTDAGVHATGQVAHIDLKPFTKLMSEFEIMKAINAHLRPKPVAVLKVEIADADFHARFHAVNKLYRYRIIQRPAALGIEKGRAWHVKKPLDVQAMQQGAKYLLGHHDFTSFRDSQCQARTPMRTLDRLDLVVTPLPYADGQLIEVETEGQSFLHHQVRNMVGTLVLVGEGKWKPEDVKTALEACDRKAAGPTAPPHGLYLERIDY